MRTEVKSVDLAGRLAWRCAKGNLSSSLATGGSIWDRPAGQRTKISRRCHFHSATASFTIVRPTRCASVRSSSCSRVAVSRRLPPLQRTDSVALAPDRRPRPDRPGARHRLRFPRGSRGIDVLPDRDVQTPARGRPPAASALLQVFVSNDMHEIHPEHPPANSGFTDPGKPAIRPSVGLLSEWRLVYFLSDAPIDTIKTSP